MRQRLGCAAALGRPFAAKNASIVYAGSRDVHTSRGTICVSADMAREVRLAGRAGPEGGCSSTASWMHHEARASGRSAPPKAQALAHAGPGLVGTLQPAACATSAQLLSIKFDLTLLKR